MTPLGQSSAEGRSETEGFALDVKHVVKDDKVALKIVLSNRSGKRIAVTVSDLPWSTRGMWMRPIVISEPERILENRHDLMVGGLQSRRVSLGAGKSLYGELALSDRYPEIVSALKRSDVLVVFVYKLRIDGEDMGSSLSGCLLVKKLPGKEKGMQSSRAGEAPPGNAMDLGM